MPGTVNTSTSWTESTVSSMIAQRWFALEFAVQSVTGAPSAVDCPPTSRSWPVAALTSVYVPSPVVDRIHCAASAGSPSAATSATAPSSSAARRSPASVVTVYRVRLPSPATAASCQSWPA